MKTTPSVPFSDIRPEVYLISLGCPKNLVDSEYVLGHLSDQGFVIGQDPARADAIIVNTCGFIQAAVEEAVSTILEMTEYKKDGSARVLAVIGCLPQRYGLELSESLPEVDLFLGTGGLDRLPGLLTAKLNGEVLTDRTAVDVRPGFIPADPAPRLRSAPFYRAYLKIAEGCSNVCSYCLIPRLRGPLNSRPVPALLDEAAALAESGVRELILVAQDTTAYGRDLKSGDGLPELLTGLARIDGLEWLRLMYAYPSGLSDAVVEVMANEPKVCPYLDLPLQHASRSVLERMKRRDLPDQLELVTRLRQNIPGLTLRTTVMVGFPGETDRDFEELLDFIDRARFERLGCFKFSPEEGVPAARYQDQVPQRIKENRRRKVMAVQRRISRAANQALVGRILPVLVEGLSPETDLLLVGRTMGQAPEIDGQVLINKGTASPGQIRPVLITEAHDYDLVGELADEEDETGLTE